VAVGGAETVQELRGTLGGDLEEGTQHGGASHDGGGHGHSG
jgi:hypothetical protein